MTGDMGRHLELFELRSETDGEADGFRSIVAAAGVPGILLSDKLLLSDRPEVEPKEDGTGVTGVRTPGGRRY